VTKRQTQKREKRAAWRLHERLVAFLEKAVAPGADVRHNINLPVLTAPERKPRQCDVVIIAGEPPRQTLTIVEVQKRGRKVGINDFHGWLGKMQEVGANQLICVSERGFPESVVVAAAQRGSQVKLLTLDSSSKSSAPPITMANVLIRPAGEFNITEVSDMKLQRGAREFDEQLSIRTDAKVFSINDAEELLSLNDLVAMILRGCAQLHPPPHIALPPELSVQMDLGDIGCAVWLQHDGLKLMIRACKVVVKVKPRRKLVPMGLTNVPYLEHGATEPEAWVSSVSVQDNDGALELTTAVRIVNGEITMSAIATREAQKG
jgi:hypothetical protein